MFSIKAPARTVPAVSVLVSVLGTTVLMVLGSGSGHPETMSKIMFKPLPSQGDGERLGGGGRTT